MAFDLRNWSRVTDSMNTGAKDLGALGTVNAPAIFSYRSDTDTQSQIASGNYFGQEAQNISPKDIIWATASNGVVQYRVTAVDRAAFSVTIQAISGGSSGVSSITGTANEVEVDNTDSQNPIIKLPSAINIPGMFAIQGTTAINAIIDDDSFATAADTNVPTAESVKAYVDTLGGGNVKSVTETANQISVDNSDPSNPVLSLPSAVVFPGTAKAGNLTLTGDDLQKTANNKVTLGNDTQDFLTNNASRMDLNNSGIRLGGANARVTTILSDNTMAGASNTNLYTGAAVKGYVDNSIVTSSGSWTPAPRFETAGTSVWTMSTVGGRWWKQGTMVTVNGRWSGTVSVGTASGIFYIGVLPYSWEYAPSNPNWNAWTAQLFAWDNTNMPIDFDDFPTFCITLKWATDLRMTLMKTGLERDVVASDFSDGGIDISFSLTYRTAS